MVNNDSTNSEAPLTGTIKMGEGMNVIEQAPTSEPSVPEVASPVAGETTSESKTNAENTDKFQAGHKKARQLGESRKKLAQGLIELAKKSESAAQTLKTIASTDPILEKYLRTKHSKDYLEIVEGRSYNDFDQQSVDDAAHLRARAELLAEQLKLQKDDQIFDYAEKLSFSKDEAEQLKELALSLEGKTIGGVELDLERALKKAAFAIREDKAKVGAMITNLPGGQMPAASMPTEKDIENETLAAQGKKLSGRPKEEIQKNLKIVEENLKGNVFRVPM